MVLPRQMAGFLLTTLLAALALMAVGLLVTAAAPGGRAAGAVGAVVFYPLVFLGGLFLPIPTMPAKLRHVSHATPVGAAVTAMQDATNGHRPHWLALLTLLLRAAGAAVAAARLVRWE